MEEKSGKIQIRTFSSDIARLIRDKKLSSEQIASLDPKLRKDIEIGEVEIPTKSLSSNTNEKRTIEVVNVNEDEMIEHMRKAATEARAKVKEAEILDLDAQQKKNLERYRIPLKKESEAPAVSLPPTPKPVAPQSPIDKLKARQLELKDELIKVQAKEKIIHDQQESFKKEKLDILSQQADLKNKETETEKSEAEILKSEKMTQPKERQELEKKRWTLEDERQRIEGERWNMDQKIVDLEKRAKSFSSDERLVLQEEAKITETLEKVHTEEVGLQAKADEVDVLKKLEEVTHDRQRLEQEWKGLLTKSKQASELELALEEKRDGIMKELRDLESKEHSVTGSAKIHDVEVSRWAKDKELRAVVQDEWKTEAEAEHIQTLMRELEQKTQSVLELEKSTKTRLGELERLIKNASSV